MQIIYLIRSYYLEYKKNSYYSKKIIIIWTSGQDGGIGRYTLPPHTTKIRTTTNFKIKNNENFQKIELYGSPTTKELKKKHSSRLAGGMETDSQGRVERGSWSGKDSWQGSGWKTRWSHMCMRIN